VVNRAFTGNTDVYEPSNDTTDLAAHPNVNIALNVQITPTLVKEGVVRHLVNRIQRLRKESGVHVSDDVEVFYTAEGDLHTLLQENQDLVQKRIGKPFISAVSRPADANVIGTTEYQCEEEAQQLMGDQKVTLEIVLRK